MNQTAQQLCVKNQGTPSEPPNFQSKERDTFACAAISGPSTTDDFLACCHSKSPTLPSYHNHTRIGNNEWADCEYTYCDLASDMDITVFNFCISQRVSNNQVLPNRTDMQTTCFRNYKDGKSPNSGVRVRGLGWMGSLVLVLGVVGAVSL